MQPCKEVLVTTLKGILLSIDNTMDNAIDTKSNVDQDGEIYEDFKDLEESQGQLNKLIKELEQ